MNAFTQAMFGEIGVIEIECPSEVTSSGYIHVCGVINSGFELFQRQWDLYSEWEEKTPVIPQALSAWKLEGEWFKRTYSFDGTMYLIFVAEDGSGQLSILVAYPE
jgi:hypothetical protein